MDPTSLRGDSSSPTSASRLVPHEQEAPTSMRKADSSSQMLEELSQNQLTSAQSNRFSQSLNLKKEVEEELKKYCLSGTSEEDLEKTEIKNCIIKFLNGETNEIDLNTCNKEAVASLPSLIIEKLKPELNNISIILPKELRKLPDWLINLKLMEGHQLNNILIPNFRGKEILLKNLSVDVVKLKDANLLNNANVIKGTSISTPHTTNFTSGPISHKVTVNFLSEAGEFYGKSTGLNRVYRTADNDNNPLILNLSEQASFQSEEEVKIKCRHLVIEEITDGQKNDKNKIEGNHANSKRRTIQRMEKLGTIKRISDNISLDTERLFHNLNCYATENRIVGHSKWGEFFVSELKEMHPNQSRYFVCTTPTHAMVVKLAIKGATEAEPEPRYAVNVYDPNVTLGTDRIVSKDLENNGEKQYAELNSISDLTMQNFLAPHYRDSYYGKEDKPNYAHASRFFMAPDNFHEQGFDEQLDKRTIKVFLSEEELSSHLTFYHFLSGGHLSNELEDRLDQCTTREEMFALLSAKGHYKNGVPGIVKAIYNNHDGTIEEWGRLALEKYEEENLTSEQIKKLFTFLTLEDQPESRAFYSAFSNSKPTTLRALGFLLLEARERGALTNDELADLLAIRPNSNGRSWSFSRAHPQHRIKNISIFGALLLKAHQQQWLSSQQIEELLISTYSRSSLFSEILESGDSDAIQAFGNVLIDLHAAGALTLEQVEYLLADEANNGEPGFFRVLKGNRPEVVKALGQVFIEAYKAEALTIKQVENLLAAKNRNAVPGLYEVLKNSNTSPNTIKEFGKLVGSVEKNAKLLDTWQALKALVSLLNAAHPNLEDMVEPIKGLEDSEMLGLHGALIRNEDLSVAEVFWDVVQDIKNYHRGLTSLDIEKLLAVKDALGFPLLFSEYTVSYIVPTGLEREDIERAGEVIFAWGQMVRQAYRMKWLNDEQLSKILNPDVRFETNTSAPYLQKLFDRVVNKREASTKELAELMSYTRLLQEIQPSKAVKRSLYDSLASKVHENIFWIIKKPTSDFTQLANQHPQEAQVLNDIMDILRN